jgi:hypothetical protein
MTFESFTGFLQSFVPAHVEVQTGEDDMLRAVDHTEGSEAYIKYSGGLDFHLQGIRDGDKGPVKIFSFKNANEMLAVLGPKVLEMLDGVRRI